jgi:hypothetical protein
MHLWCINQSGILIHHSYDISRNHLQISPFWYIH